LKNDSTDPWYLELTDDQYRRLETMANTQGLSVNFYVRFLVQDHAQSLLEEDADNRRLGLRVVDEDYLNPKGIPS